MVKSSGWPHQNVSIYFLYDSISEASASKIKLVLLNKKYNFLSPEKTFYGVLYWIMKYRQEKLFENNSSIYEKKKKKKNRKF